MSDPVREETGERERLWALETEDSERREIEGDYLDAIEKLGYELVTHNEKDGPCFGCSLSKMLDKLAASSVSQRGTGERDIRDWLKTPQALSLLTAHLARVQLYCAPSELTPVLLDRVRAKAGREIDRFLKLAEHFYVSVPSQQEDDDA